MLITIAILCACFFAINIGGSGTAAAMGAAYGAGAVRNRWLAVSLVGLFSLFGAVYGGGQVTETISSGIIPFDSVTVSVTILIITSAALTLFAANKLGIPLSTSEVTVGSFVGVGLVLQKLYLIQLLSIVSVWVILPIVSYWLAKGLGKGISYIERNWLARIRHKPWMNLILMGFLLFFGCYEAFAAGMNNVGNAIGPLISSDILSLQNGLWLGAIFMSVGAILLGGPVLETSGRKITRLSLLQGSGVSFTSGSLVMIASYFGIPVPLTQATTMAIIGIGSNQSKVKIWRHQVVKRIILVWILSPLTAMITSFTLMHLFVLHNPYPLMVMICCFFYLEAFRLKIAQSHLV